LVPVLLVVLPVPTEPVALVVAVPLLFVLALVEPAPALVPLPVGR